MPAPGFRLLAAFASFLAVLLAGCESQPPPAATMPEPAPAPVAAPPAPDVQPLLDRARTALDEQRLTLPAEGSAFALYQEVLRLDPGNEDARRGLEQIVERYIRFALESIEGRQFARARSMLARARLVDATHPAIEPTEQQARLVEGADRARSRLDTAALAQRSASMATRLRLLGSRAKETPCRVLIYARSDAEGRWIYQQLNSAAGEARIRARFEVASPPSVELVCLGRPEQPSRQAPDGERDSVGG